MKKILSVLAIGAAVMTASAQSVEDNKFFDNWSIGLVGGGITKTTHNAFWGGMRGTYGLELTKQVTPVFGLTLQGLANNNTTPSRTGIDQMNVSMLGNVNLFNLFGGYQGAPRVFEMEAVAGAGWGHEFYNSGMAKDNNFLTSKFGMNFNFNLGEAKAWTVAFKPAIVYSMDKSNTNGNNSYNVNNSAIELLAGVTYHFKNSNGKHHFTNVRAYDQAEVDGLNAKINDLRGTVRSKDGHLAAKDAEIRDLQQRLNEARNQKPQVERIVTNTVTNTTTEKLESVVTFRQGKSVVDLSQQPNVERIATYLKNHKDATVSIKGYASPEGNAAFNERLAQARAEAVKTILVKKYKISADRIKAEGQGVGNMFSEPDWNRVSISTIDDQK